MSDRKTEACGRCSMTSVVDAAVEDEDRDPFGDERIEVEDTEFRRISPAVWIGKIGGRLDDIVQRLTYGR